MQQPLTMSTSVIVGVDTESRFTSLRWKKPGCPGSVKRATVRVPHLMRRVPHEADYRAEDAVEWGIPRRGGEDRATKSRMPDHGVVVEKDNQVGSEAEGVTDADVVAAGPAAVHGVAYDGAPGEPARERRGRVIYGRVVHDDGIRARRRFERAQTTERVGQAVVVDEDDAATQNVLSIESYGRASRIAQSVSAASAVNARRELQPRRSSVGVANRSCPGV